MDNHVHLVLVPESEIDAAPWLVNEATHTLDGSGGLTSSIRLVSLAC